MQKSSRIYLKKTDDDYLVVSLFADIVGYNSEILLRDLPEVLADKSIKGVKFDSQKLKEWDSSLLLIVYKSVQCAKANHKEYDLNNLPKSLQDLVNLAFAVDREPSRTLEDLPFVEKLGKLIISIGQKISKVINFIGMAAVSIGKFFTFNSVMRKTDFWEALTECGPKAIAIVSLISFLIGLILAFVGAVQLQTFGAQIYVASLVTIGMCRIMGAIMVGIIMAGRTGSAYAATIGTMQVNEELDALYTMGLSQIDFLVLPRLFALLIAMPILTMIADFFGILGGAFVGVFLMDLPYQEYWHYAMEAFTLNNFLVGIFHGFCFGFIIALCGCYSGLMCGRNADSVGVSTTKSVVCSIVWMIVITGIITVICQEIGV